MDLLLTDHDLDITNGELSWVYGAEAVGQDTKMALRTFLGETPYDTTVGVPWIQVIFNRGVDLNTVKFVVENIIRRRPGVIAVDVTPTLDPETRVVTIEGTAQTTDEEIDFTEIIGVP